MKKYTLITLFAWLPCLLIAQNNFVFAGGSDDGSASERTASQTNNPIFDGGKDDGSASNRTVTETNNGIFDGGMNDGHASERTATPTNSNIFAGGIDDGSASARTETPSNGNIFNGGKNDGYASFYLETALPLRFPAQLDVSLVSFAALAEEGNVRLVWKTSSEVNHDYFIIEKSRNITEVETVGGNISGIGNDQQGADYQQFDFYPYENQSFYRLKMVDKNGEASYSEWAEVWFSKNQQIHISIYPNPVKNKLTIKVSGIATGATSWLLTDMSGRMMKQGALQQAGSITIDISAFAEGMYLMHVINGKGEKVRTSKLVKMN